MNTTTQIAYKAFDKDLKCLDFQYEIGKTYKYGGPVKTCESGFHACLRPLDVLLFYPPTSRFAVVEIGGDIDGPAPTDTSSKIAASEITPLREIDLRELTAKTLEFDSAHRKQSKDLHTASRPVARSVSTGYGSAKWRYGLRGG